MKVTPFAVAGRWRATTSPATMTRRPCWIRSSAQLAFGNERLHLLFLDAEHVSKADPNCAPLDPAFDRALVDVRGKDLDATPLCVVNERIRWVEAHRLLVQKRTEELGRVVDAQP